MWSDGDHNQSTVRRRAHNNGTNEMIAFSLHHPAMSNSKFGDENKIHDICILYLVNNQFKHIQENLLDI